MLRLPPAIRRGDTLSIVAPSGPIDASAFERAVAELARRGFRTKTYRDIHQREGYLAGSDAQRVDELNQALRDADTSAILPVRGGYGAARIVDQLDYGAMAARPKLLCGFSDITAIHAAVHRYAKVATLHGPNLQDGIGTPGGLAPAVAASYWQALTCEQQPSSQEAKAPQNDIVTITPGVAEGPLVGGNLAVLCGLIGTPFEPDTKAAILLLEDIGEAPYRLDRMLAQLRLAGMLRNLAGVVLGQFTDCTPSDPAKSYCADEVFAGYFGELGVPVIANYPVGHASANFTVPLGVSVRLDAGARLLDCSASFTTHFAEPDTEP